MKHDEIKALIPPYLEGDLEPEKKDAVEAHLADCFECQQELEAFDRLEEVLSHMRLKKPPRELWKTYWSSVYNKIERRFAWIIISIGAMVVLGFGIYELLEEFFKNPENSLVLKLGVSGLIIGGIILLVSILREQLFFRKNERYKEVEE